MKHSILIFLFFIISLFSVLATNVKFYNVNRLHGISMRETASVCKDSKGFIWASSKTGILRIAGDDHRIYQLPFQALNILNVKLTSTNSELYAYTSNGQVFRYNPVYDRFDVFFDITKILNRGVYVTNMFADHRNVIWIPSNIGFYKFEDGELLRLTEPESNVSRVTALDDNRLLIICNDGIKLMNTKTGQINPVYNRTFPAGISSLHYDSTMNKVWIGTMSDGLSSYDFNNNTFYQFPVQTFPKQPILAIEKSTDSTLYVGIDGQGIREFDKNSNRIINSYKENLDDPCSIFGNGVYDIFNDIENQRVWVTTYSGGLSFFEQIPKLVNHIVHQINNPNSLINNNVNQIIEDSRGNIWFATDNGISHWNVHQNKWQTFFQNKQEEAQVFLSLCEDNNNRIWAGTYSSGVYILDLNTGRQLAHYTGYDQNSGFNCNFTYDIISDHSGDIWLGGVMDGVYHYKAKENKFEAFPRITVYNFSEFSDNEILAACASGLYIIDKQAKNFRRLVEGYMVVDVLEINGSAWMCTQGNGLVQFEIETKTITEYTTELGFPSNYLNSIIFANGYLWIGTENGICKFNPDEKTVTNVSSHLPQASYNRNAVCRLSNGQLAWGTSNGAIIFDPASLQETPRQGSIFLQDILVSGRSVRIDDSFDLKLPLDSLNELTLGYDQNNLALEFLPLGFNSGYKFSWILEGFDSHPSHPSNDRKFSYTNIPTGKYLLKIRMFDYSLSQIVAERQLIIHITPPFWETLWFRIMLFMVFAAMIFFPLRFYINRLEKKHMEDKVHFFTNMAHEIRTIVTLIKAPIEEIIGKNFPEKEKYYLNLAAEQARRLSSTVTHLLDFQKVDIGKEQLSLSMLNVVNMIEYRRLIFEYFAQNKNIVLSFEADPATYSTAIDQQKMEKVIDNLISNAVKYSNPDSKVELFFIGNEKYWSLEVKDYGIGICKKAQRKLFKEFYRSENAINSNNVGSGIGLLIAKSYVTLHGGTIQCESRENEGSSFKITIPYKKILSAENKEIQEITHVSDSRNSILNNDNTYKKMRLIIVEDNENLRQFMINSLCEEFDVLSAKDGIIAWDIIRKQMPDIVVSDVMMPNMDGFELCRLIKSTDETSHIPVILLTALDEKAQQLYGLGLGADSYLTKPFDMRLVYQSIRSIIQNRKAVRDKVFKLFEQENDETLFINDLNDKFMKKAIEVVQANMANEEFDKDEFASAMNVSPSGLYKKIKSFTDLSPVDFIKNIRLNHAMELLKSQQHTVTEVSELCGFSGINYFSKTFKKHFGKTPSEI